MCILHPQHDGQQVRLQSLSSATKMTGSDDVLHRGTVDSANGVLINLLEPMVGLERLLSIPPRCFESAAEYLTLLSMFVHHFLDLVSAGNVLSTPSEVRI